ncbi:MAG: monovalent cation/H+ antiporter subunit D [Myxococcota bacterium]|nr:monovalent cation/H+ antiporter subunit D [Myxococcota bacterium]
MSLLSHLIALPVVLPLVTAALLLFIGDERRRLKSRLNVLSTLAGVVVAVAILRRVDHGSGSGSLQVYLAANWQAPFGIVLVADRLSALMLVLVSVVGLAAALYAEAAWVRASVYFLPLFQIQLMGLNGAFLTGDLFNLFVFFEVMLAASYGLQLHGSGIRRVRSGLHYIAVNLLASLLFLVGLSVLYGILGTLTMADMAAKIALVPERDRGLLHAGAAILALAFLIKAAVWPLNAWLVPAYTATSAPVAALFAVMTKVGVYTILRLGTLCFSSAAGASAGFGQQALFYGGLATIAFGTLGLLASARLARLASYSIVVSSGTLLAALGVGDPTVTAAALYYLMSGTLAASALFLLVEQIERLRAGGRAQLALVDLAPGEDTNLDDEARPLVGRVLPISTALIGLAFMACTMVVAGLPPLSGFVAKLSLLSAVMSREHAPAQAWVFFALLLLSGLASTFALTRAGIRHFWSWDAGMASVKRVEAFAVVGLLSSCLALALWAEPILRYTAFAAAGLHEPGPYVDGVLSRPALPSAGSRFLEVER